MKYGLWYFKNTHNIGDDMWAYAQSLFYPHIDYLIDNTEAYKFKSDNNEDVATIVAAFVEPYNYEYSFMPPTNLIPFFISSYFRPTMWEVLNHDIIKAYLKAFEPIGCRTREQATKVCDMGVDAFFDGCITLTLPDLKKEKDEYLCCVDVPDYIVEFVKERVAGKYEVKIMSHDVQNIAKHSNLSISERFEIVRDYIEIYAGAHCVVTSRLHAALPCLTQRTPVLLTTTGERVVGVNDIQSRLKDFLPLLHHNSYDDFLNPPKNSDQYISLQDNLTKKCREFVEKCEGGDIVNRCPYTEQQRAEETIDILQSKILQLKNVIDGMKVKVMEQ